jgi:hypothetical protein
LKSIWRFELDITDETELHMPKGAQILTVQRRENAGRLDMWALVDPTAPQEPRTFRVIGTGHPIPDVDALTYYATAQVAGGQLVFHVFERVS